MRYAALLFACFRLIGAESFPASDVSILGDLDYGKTSEALECAAAKPKLCALVFNGMSGDTVEVVVSPAAGSAKTFVAIADGGLVELARGPGRVTFKLPKVAEDLATYYIVFRGEDGKGGRFTVQLNKKTQ